MNDLSEISTVTHHADNISTAPKNRLAHVANINSRRIVLPDQFVPLCVVVGLIVFVGLRHGFAGHALPAGGIASIAWSVIARLLWLVLGALVTLGAIDYLLARRAFARK